MTDVPHEARIPDANEALRGLDAILQMQVDRNSPQFVHILDGARRLILQDRDADVATLTRRLNQQGFGGVRPVTKLGGTKDREWAQLYEAGWTLDQIGKRFGCSGFMVGKRLKKNGVTLRRPGRRAHFTLGKTADKA